ncbi:MAG: permease-like cell division protein FtsX, partial [Syntrophales bacterium LBB04]|nr:permease-like cell division protein FtsX [Syntrophales bacterium LBB04]
MTRIAYFFRRATSNMSGDFWANAGTVLVIALSLSIPGAFLLAWANAAKFAQTWVGQGQVVAYVKDNAPQDQVESLRRRLLSDPRIRSCSFVSKDEALQRFKQGPKEIAELIDGLSENPLPAS